MVECCGQPCIYDEIDGSPIVYCPKCGKDYTYESYERDIQMESASAQREPGRNEVSRIRRDEVRWRV